MPESRALRVLPWSRIHFEPIVGDRYALTIDGEYVGTLNVDAAAKESFSHMPTIEEHEAEIAQAMQMMRGFTTGPTP